jgi:AAA family ATP:ADP antiporter
VFDIYPGFVKDGGNEMEGRMNNENRSFGFLYKFLGLFTKVHPGEAATLLLLTLTGFLVMGAYYIVKPVREGLILGGTSAEFKSYLSVAAVILLIFVVKAFSRIASKVSRQKLITWVTLFFISNLIIFYLLSFTNISKPAYGTAFFIWIAIFNVMVVAQFWAFANDIYTPEEGKRLFPLVAFGATFGAFAGSKTSGWLVAPIGSFQLMLVCAGALFISVVLIWIVHSREINKPQPAKNGEQPVNEKPGRDKEKPLGKEGGFKLVFKKKYLLYLAIFILLLNFINTNGEYILGRVVRIAAAQAVDAGTAGGLILEDYITKFYADFYSIVNFLTWFIQLFLVSRIFKWFGIRGAIFFLPLLSLGGYMFVALGASLVIVRLTKTLENSTDYSLMNTTRHSLFLITSREEKYKAKAAIDTFFHRGGDVLSGVLVLAGTTLLALNIEGFAVFNVFFALIWILVGFLVAREHKKVSAGLTGSKP